MRLKRFLLGSFLGIVLIALFVSARFYPALPDEGTGVGERLPNIKVGTMELQDVIGKKDTFVVLWSKENAESRLVNAWVSQQINAGYQVLSICVDAETREAQQCAKIDDVDTQRVKVLGTSDGGTFRTLLGTREQLMVYRVAQGTIAEVRAVEIMWNTLARR